MIEVKVKSLVFCVDNSGPLNPLLNRMIVGNMVRYILIE